MMKKIGNACRVSLVSCLLLVGCDQRPPSLTRQQVDELIRMPADATTASRELVSQDAQARQDWLAIQGDLQAAQLEIGRQRDVLATERRYDSLLAAAVEQTSMLLACLLPVLIVTFLVWPRPATPDAQHACDLLVTEVTQAPPRRRIALASRRRLTRPRDTHSRSHD